MIHPSTTQSLELQLALYTVKQRPMARGDRVLSTLFQTVGAYGIHQQKGSNVEVTWAPATGESPSWPAIQQEQKLTYADMTASWGAYFWPAMSSWSNIVIRATREPKLDESSHRCACQMGQLLMLSHTNEQLFSRFLHTCALRQSGGAGSEIKAYLWFEHVLNTHQQKHTLL